MVLLSSDVLSLPFLLDVLLLVYVGSRADVYLFIYLFTFKFRIALNRINEHNESRSVCLLVLTNETALFLFCLSSVFYTLLLSMLR